MTRQKIGRFVAAWYDELAEQGTVRREDVAGHVKSLNEALRRPDLWRLAPNPLLLTVMALVHTHKGRLPDARALLYEETVDILLWRWEQIKAGGAADETPQLRQLLLQANRGDVDLKRVLWRLAFEAHSQGGAGDDGEKLADIGELRLLKELGGLCCGDLGWAQQVVEAMKLRAGLLIERQAGGLHFPAPHLPGVSGGCAPGRAGRLRPPGGRAGGRGRALAGGDHAGRGQAGVPERRPGQAAGAGRRIVSEQGLTTRTWPGARPGWPATCCWRWGRAVHKTPSWGGNCWSACGAGWPNWSR